MKKGIIKNLLHRFTLLLVVVVFSSVTVASAATPMDRSMLDVLDRDSTWYSTEAFEGCSGADITVTVDGSENAKAAFQYFIGRGLSPMQSAGIVGNLQAESGVIPTAQEIKPTGRDGRGGYGIAQWTDGRRTALETYARENGKDLNSLQFQLDYLWNQELSVGYYKRVVLDPLKLTTTIRAASDIFLHKFEVPANASSKEVQRAAMGQKIYDLYAADAGTVIAPVEQNLACTTTPGGVIGGFVGFPLQTTKASMTRLNGGCFKNGVMCQGGHPYAAHDIIADVGTPTVSILDGVVISVGQDKCPGRLISIYSEAQDVTVSYLHLSLSKNVVRTGQRVTAGQLIGFVGTRSEGCSIPHLHIDAASGKPRPGCRRENCPVANQARFIAGSDTIKLPQSLYNGYTNLP